MAANFLKKKYGPLPGWGWGVVLGGGLLLGLYLRKRFANSASSGSSGGSVPSSVQPAAADGSGGSVGSSVAPTDSGLTSDLENALLNSQNSLVGTINTLGGVITAQQQSFGDLTTQTFAFEKSITSDLTGLLQHLGTTAPGGSVSSQTTSAPGVTPSKTATSPAGSVAKPVPVSAYQASSTAEKAKIRSAVNKEATTQKILTHGNVGTG